MILSPYQETSLTGLLSWVSQRKESACNAGDAGRSLGQKNPLENKWYGNPIQHSCLGNPRDRGAWQDIFYVFTRVGHNLATKPPSPGNLIPKDMTLWYDLLQPVQLWSAPQGSHLWMSLGMLTNVPGFLFFWAHSNMHFPSLFEVSCGYLQILILPFASNLDKIGNIPKPYFHLWHEEYILDS